MSHKPHKKSFILPGKAAAWQAAAEQKETDRRAEREKTKGKRHFFSLEVGMGDAGVEGSQGLTNAAVSSHRA